MERTGMCGIRFTCRRCNQSPNTQPIANAHTMASAIAHQTPATSETTCGVK